MASHSEIAEPQALGRQRFKVLLVEDNPGDARLIQESLAEAKGVPFDVEITDRLASALLRLSDGGIDALLLDLGLPDSKGVETFEKAKAHAPQVPIIVLTGHADEAVALKMVQDGAQDYVTKIDLNASRLSRVVSHAILRERTDQQTRKFNKELEHRVMVRTAELEAANEELEAFSYSVSHDLRAPLRHIDGFSRLLLESCGPQIGKEGQKYLDRICVATKHMASLIDDLLKLAKVGRHVLSVEAVDLSALAGKVVEEFSGEIGERQIEWKIGALPTVVCDAGLVKQVFSNLIGNSIKYTRACQNAVIETGQTVVGSTPAFYVRDNGAGFDMKYAGRLFGAFQRLHHDTEFEGTGIGLATVRRIVERHGGRIWAEAEAGKGATFYFTLETSADAYLTRRG